MHQAAAHPGSITKPHHRPNDRYYGKGMLNNRPSFTSCLRLQIPKVNPGSPGTGAEDGDGRFNDVKRIISAAKRPASATAVAAAKGRRIRHPPLPRLRAATHAGVNRGSPCGAGGCCESGCIKRQLAAFPNQRQQPERQRAALPAVIREGVKAGSSDTQECKR